MSEITREQEEAMTREIDAHDEALKEAIERGLCLMCARGPLEIRVLPRAIRFYCSCGWSAIYPIRTLGNSEQAQNDESLDLITLAEREVIAKARAYWRSQIAANPAAVPAASGELLDAVTLLESRETNKEQQ